MKNFIPGITTVMLLCIVCFFLPHSATSEFIRTLYFYYMAVMVAAAFLGVAAGLLKWLLTGSTTTLLSAVRIFGGNFYTDDKQTFLYSVFKELIRHTWEIFQTSLGHIYLQTQNAFNSQKRVEYWGGATFLILENQKTRKGVSIGTFINVYIKDVLKTDFETTITSGLLFMHEYGHTFDSRKLGVFYLPFIGLPSLISAATAKPVEGQKGMLTHDYRWYEMSANRHAARYFKKYYSFDWKVFEDLYPLQKPSDYA